MHRGSTSLPRVWNDKWQPIRLNLRFLSLLKRSQFVHPQSNIQKTKSIKDVHFYSKILYLSFVLMSIFPAKQCGEKTLLNFRF